MPFGNQRLPAKKTYNLYDKPQVAEPKAKAANLPQHMCPTTHHHSTTAPTAFVFPSKTRPEYRQLG